jgi:hypothetical protein
VIDLGVGSTSSTRAPDFAEAPGFIRTTPVEPAGSDERYSVRELGGKECSNPPTCREL